MPLRCVCVVLLTVAAAACSKSPSKDTGAGSAASTTTATTPPPAADAAAASSDSAAPGSDAAAGSDSSAAGSGSSTPGSGSSATDEGSGGSEFDKLSREDKIKFMKTKVMPAMKAVFQSFDAKDYAKFNCKTCHGKDPRATKYKMPNPDLKPLDFDAIKAGKEDPKMVEFMSKKVKPEMAKILGMPEMTQTQQGFGCLDCHTQKKK